MSYVTHKEQALGGTSLWQALADLKASLAQRLAQHQLYRTTLNELGALSDRDLADLGIHRADIRDIALDAAYGA